MMDPKIETRMVKQALAKAGIKARVGHGTGTAASWLHVYIGNGSHLGEHIPPPPERQGCHCAGADAGCARCQWVRETCANVERITLQVTDRLRTHGKEYGGDINIYLAR